MKLILIRHQKLLPPYDDYSKLDLETIDALATYKIDPQIQKIEKSKIIKYKKFFDASEKIFSSNSKRCIETTRKILKILNLEKEIIIDNRLREIYFSPKLMIKNLNKKNPLELIRERLYFNSYYNHCSTESLKKINKRIEDFLEDIKNYNLVIGIIHEFLMRIFYFYQKFKRFPSLISDIEFLTKMQAFNYLESISILIN